MSEAGEGDMDGRLRIWSCGCMVNYANDKSNVCEDHRVAFENLIDGGDTAMVGTRRLAEVRREAEEYDDDLAVAFAHIAELEAKLAEAEAKLAEAERERDELKAAIHEVVKDASGTDNLDRLKTFKADHDWYAEALDKVIEQRNNADGAAASMWPVVEAAKACVGDLRNAGYRLSDNARALIAAVDALAVAGSSGQASAAGGGETGPGVEATGPRCERCDQPIEWRDDIDWWVHVNAGNDTHMPPNQREIAEDPGSVADGGGEGEAHQRAPLTDVCTYCGETWPCAPYIAWGNDGLHQRERASRAGQTGEEMAGDA